MFFKCCDLVLVPSVDLFRPIRLHTSGRITIGPAESHCITNQSAKSLQQNDTRTWFVGHLADNDVDMLACHLMNLTLPMLFKKTVDNTTIIVAARGRQRLILPQRRLAAAMQAARSAQGSGATTRRSR